ncbi:MAG: WxL domain-containing protein [Patulibacter sp.]
MLAVVRWQLGSDASSVTYGQSPTTWTLVNTYDVNDTATSPNSFGSTGLWWRRATADDVSATSFTFTRSWSGNRQVVVAGAIAAFSGVDTTTSPPFAWGAIRRSRETSGANPSIIGNGCTGLPRPGSANADNSCTDDNNYPTGDLPTYTATRNSMSVSLAGLQNASSTTAITVSSILDNGTLATTKGEAGASSVEHGIGVGIGYRAADSDGTYSAPHTRFQLSASGTFQPAWSLVLKPACSATGLTIAADSIAFGSTTLSGANTTLTTSATFTVDDESNSNAGWKVTLSPTQFTASGGKTLPTDALTATAASDADGGSRCSAPSSTVSYSSPVALPSGTATPVFNSAAGGSGRGPSQITLTTQLAIPANALQGSYSSTWTYTVSSGPT